MPFLIFSEKAEEAMNDYVSIFKGAERLTASIIILK
jgi:predicted 3-demethylubiquinone-9 3-methyltransferase (glyoxalase superfamily)